MSSKDEEDSKTSCETQLDNENWFNNCIVNIFKKRHKLSIEELCKKYKVNKDTKTETNTRIQQNLGIKMEDYANELETSLIREKKHHQKDGGKSKPFHNKHGKDSDANKDEQR